MNMIEAIKEEEAMSNPNDMKVTVCDNCLCASCLQGVFFCEKYIIAGIKEMTVEELINLNREHPDYWQAVEPKERSE